MTRIYPRITATLLLLIATVLLPGLSAVAQVEITVSKGRKSALPIAVPVLTASGGVAQQIAPEVAAVIRNNLERSGALRVVNPQGYPAGAVAEPAQPDFASWRKTDAQALISGSVDQLVDGRLQINFWLFETDSGKQLKGLSYSAPRQNWRRIAHIISDEVYTALTGDDGMFDSRIVYVSETGSALSRIKRLAIMDQDGGNHRYLTDGSALVLTPNFSPTRQEITYLSYLGNRPRVYLLNLETGQQEDLGDFPGTSFSPRFSPDGRSVVLSLALNGNTDIYRLDLASRQMVQLTRHPAIDTSASFDPDGKRLVFNSDRGGAQEIYVMNADGSGVERISFGEGNYATPVWSPTGEWIAFTRINGNDFSIGIMKPDGRQERILTTDFLVEGPAWSPNGRVLTYFKQNPSGEDGLAGEVGLYAIDLFSFKERRLPTPADASDPSWSPILPR